MELPILFHRFNFLFQLRGVINFNPEFNQFIENWISLFHID